MPQTAQRLEQFIILTYNEHSQLDAASVFETAPEDAWKQAAQLARFTKSSKFQLYAAERADNGAVKFSRVEKPRR